MFIGASCFEIIAITVVDLEGFLGFRPKPPLRFQKPPEDLMEDALKLKLLEGSAMPLFLFHS